MCNIAHFGLQHTFSSELFFSPKSALEYNMYNLLVPHFNFHIVLKVV